MTTGTITHNIDAQRYELIVDRQFVAYAQYFATDDTVTFIHTEVLPGHEGKGYGSQLAEGAVGAVRDQHKQVRSSLTRGSPERQSGQAGMIIVDNLQLM